jgi:hypothetical protein
MDELVSQSVGEGTEPRTIDSIVDEVLGTRLSYIKGFGYGPKSNKQNANTANSQLSEKLDKITKKLKQYKLNFKLLQDHMQVMTQAIWLVMEWKCQCHNFLVIICFKFILITLKCSFFSFLFFFFFLKFTCHCIFSLFLLIYLLFSLNVYCSSK